jgi:amino acid transporter
MAITEPELRTDGDAALLRTIGFWGLTASIINITIGATIFTLPAGLSQSMGAAAPLAFVLGALVFVPIAICFAAAGSRIHATGGAYSYVAAAFGEFPGFLVAAVLWISNVAANGSIAAALADQAKQVSPMLGGAGIRDGIILVVYAIITTLNVRGVQLGARVVMGFALTKLLPLLFLVTLGWFWVHPANLHVATVPGAATIGASMVLVIFAYSGMETALLPSGEVSNPSRVVPRATLTAIGAVVLIYVGLQLVAQGVLGAALATSTAPLASVAGAIAPGLFGVLILTASVSQFGYLHNDLLGSSRLLYAMARDGYLPSPLAKVAPRSRVPTIAILVHAAIGCLLAIVGDFVGLALISGGAVCVVYLAVCAAAWWLQRCDARGEGTPYRLVGGLLIPLVGSVGLGLVLSTLQPKEWLAIGYALLAIMIIYAIVRVARSRKN